MKRVIWSTGMVLSLLGQVHAHEGHGKPGEGNTLQHYLFEPVHLPLAVVSFAAIAFVLFLVMRMSNPSRRHPTRDTSPAFHLDRS